MKINEYLMSSMVDPKHVDKYGSVMAEFMGHVDSKNMMHTQKIL